MKRLTRKIREEYVINLSKEAKTSPKRIWQYVNCKSKMQHGKGYLFTDQKVTRIMSRIGEDQYRRKKAINVLSVFLAVYLLWKRKEKHQGFRKENTWHKVSIDSEKIQKLLENFKPDKSTCMNQIHSKFLRE